MSQGKHLSPGGGRRRPSGGRHAPGANTRRDPAPVPDLAGLESPPGEEIEEVLTAEEEAEVSPAGEADAPAESAPDPQLSEPEEAELPPAPPVRREKPSPLRRAKAARARAPLPRALWLALIPAAVLFLELLLRLTAKMTLSYAGLPGSLLQALAYGCLAAGLCTLLRSEKAASWLGFVFTELFVLWFVVAFFMDNSYTVFMPPAIMLSEAGNVVGNFGGNVKNVLVLGLPMILLYHVPSALYLLLRRRSAFTGSRRAGIVLLGLTLLCALGGWGLNHRSAELRLRYDSGYTYDNAVRGFGLLSALQQDLRHSLSGGGESYSFDAPAPTPAPAATAAPVTREGDQAEDAPKEPEYNVMDLDFSRAMEPAAVQKLTEFIQSRTPTRKNEYTGMFAGKNLILITAEAFAKEVIDPERTPALYRMASKGVVFEDFYQPAWGGSTSTGEYSWLMGLAPTNATTMIASDKRNLYFTMGNQLQRLGYFSRAYHNGSYTYYSRNVTHTNLGYSEYIAVGSGMEAGLKGNVFPESDKDMFDFTVPQYIDHQPFSVYYMTISGHASYAFSPDVNDMSVKNRDAVADLDCSDAVKAYLACNMELEYAMESLLSQLEAAGIADDTVVALVPDHYPYGLRPSSAWGTPYDALTELYGFYDHMPWGRDHNAAILWCGELEEREEPITVPGPTSSLDLLPTLSNLFGLEFDSRLLAGNDVFAGEDPLVFWNDFSWITEKGTYDPYENVFTPAEGAEIEEGYAERITAEVRGKVSLSRAIEDYDYYRLLFGEDTVK